MYGHSNQTINPTKTKSLILNKPKFFNKTDLKLTLGNF